MLCECVCISFIISIVRVCERMIVCWYSFLSVFPRERYEFSFCALLMVFTDFAFLILYGIQFWSMHFMCLRSFLSFCTHLALCVFCSFSSLFVYFFFACGDTTSLYFALVRASDGAFWAAVCSYSCTRNSKCTYAIVPAAHKNHETTHLARHASRKKAEVVSKAANGNVIIIKYL